MPRQRDIVMGKSTPDKLREFILKAAIEKYEPYRVFKDPIQKDYAVVYVHPLNQVRQLIARRNQRTNAVKLRGMLEQAWAEGKFLGVE